MLYVTYGPYNLQTKEGRNGTTLDLNTRALAVFWDHIEQSSKRDLRNARGVYIFSSKENYNYSPWYVGQSKKGFEGEVFNVSNKNKYQTAYSHDMDSEQAVMFFVAKVTPKTGKLAKSLPIAEANFVEHEIMRHALAANPQLKNSSNTGFFRNWEIRGIINTEEEDMKELDSPTKRLRNCLNIRGNPHVFKLPLYS